MRMQQLRLPTAFEAVQALRFPEPVPTSVWDPSRAKRCSFRLGQRVEPTDSSRPKSCLYKQHDSRRVDQTVRQNGAEPAIESVGPEQHAPLTQVGQKMDHRGEELVVELPPDIGRGPGECVLHGLLGL